jgi:hypothetical protein
MQQDSIRSGIFVFLAKLLIIVLIFGAFPVFLVEVVKNYNKKAEGIIEKQRALEDLHSGKDNTEVSVLTESDARAFQSISNTVVGEWKNPLDPNYRIRFENDNSFNEYRGDQKVGYGIWRVRIEHRDIDIQSDNKRASTTNASDQPTDLSLSSYIGSNAEASYYIVRTQFESGKKLDPVKYEINLLNDNAFSVSLPDGSVINFSR